MEKISWADFTFQFYFIFSCVWGSGVAGGQDWDDMVSVQELLIQTGQLKKMVELL